MTDPEGRWRVFRTGLLRSAGFPFEWVAALADSALEDQGAQVVNAHEQRERTRAETIRALWVMRGDAQPADLRILNRAIHRVRGRKTVAETHAVVAATTSGWNAAVAEFDALQGSVCAELRAALPAEYEREVGLLLGHVTADYFKDAVLLSSPLFYEACCRASDDGAFRRSKDELAAYRFLQRFSAKNETGGSIGPVNLMVIGAAGEDAAAPAGAVQQTEDAVVGRVEYVADGDGRSAERRTLMSYWAACELGISLIANAADTGDVRRPYRLFEAPMPVLSEVDARVLGHVDGRRSITVLASELGLSTEAVDASISRLAGGRLVSDIWRVPDFTTDPGEDLLGLAARIGTPDAKRAGELVAEVTGFARASLEERPALLSAITDEYSRMTSGPAWRGPGELRSDRAVLYEEATGNVQAARVGLAGARRLTERLSTALEFLASVAIEKRAAGQALLARELAARHVRELPATEVRTMPVGAPPSAPGHPTLRERLLELVDPSATAVELSRHDLTEAGLVRGDLDDWPIFGSADLMLTGGAADPGSIIMGELHHIWPTLGCWVRALYDDDELGNEELWQIVAGELAPAVPTLQEIVRHEKATDSSPYGHTVLCLDTGLPVPGTVTVPAERAVVRRWENGFIGLHDPVDRRDLWLLPEYDDSGVDVGGLINCAIPALSLKEFTLGPYTPRIAVDGVVIQRRRWEVAVADVPTVSGRVPVDREWLAVQIWRHGLGLPRRTYFLPDSEGKPIYLDFASVLSVTNFLRCLRPAQRVVLTEALPDPERLWLRTEAGTLTSEIRTLLWRDRRTTSPPA